MTDKKDKKDKKEEEDKKEEKTDHVAEAEALLEALGIDPKTTLAKLKQAIADKRGCAVEQVSDKDVVKACAYLRKNKEGAKVLRDLGILVRPGLIKASTIGHDIDHLLAKGFDNKVAGIHGLTTKAVSAVFIGMMVYAKASAEA